MDIGAHIVKRALELVDVYWTTLEFLLAATAQNLKCLAKLVPA